MKPVSMHLAVALLVSGLARAADETAPEATTKYESYAAEYVLNDDASHVATRTWAITVLKESAVAEVKSAYITYSTSVEKAEVLTAYTRKPDGHHVDVPPSNFQLEVNSGQAKDAPVFSDLTTLTVVFPDVAVGDTLVLSYRITQLEAIFPGQFSVIEYFPRTYGYDNARIRIDWPTALWTQHEQRGLTETVNEERDGRKVLEWTFSNPVPARPDLTPYGVFDYEAHPGFAFSTFRNYAEIALAYGARATPKAAVTERVRTLADELAHDANTPRTQAHALYDWVATKISYAGNCVGVGAVVPHDLDFILDNRMGDCKDHATLLQALLAAKGIASTQALVNASSVYQLPKVPVVSTVNHVITYIPTLDLYLDSTSPTTPFGMLPFSSADKPALLVDGYRDGARTPRSPHDTSRQTMKTRVRIASDGSAAGSTQVVLNGEFAARMRARLRHLSPDQEEQMVKAVFRRGGQEGAGKLTRDDPVPLLDVFNYSVNFDLKKFIKPGSTAAMSIYPLFASEAPVGFFLGAAMEPEPESTMSCMGGHSIEEYTYQFPPNTKIIAVPTNVKLDQDALSYRATYRRKGNVVTVVRRFDDRTPGNTCTPAMGKAYKAFASRVLEDVKAQVIYR